MTAGDGGAAHEEENPGAYEQRRALRAATGAAVALLIVLLALPTFRRPGAPMDEGTLLVYPDRILAGEVPLRDFETFYGPAGFYLIAGAFTAFGTGLDTERGVAVGYDVLIVLALFALVLPWGLIPASASALVAGAVCLAFGIAAYPWFGALAFALVGLACLARAARAPTTHGARSRVLIAAGLAAGVAILFRADIAPAVILGALPLLTLMTWRDAARYLVGLLVGVSAAFPFALAVGADRLSRVVRDLQASQAGRGLPLVPPISAQVALLLVTTTTLTLTLLVVALLGVRRRPRDPDGRVLLALGLFAVGIYPYILRRADMFHVLGVGVVALGTAPLLAAIVLRASGRGEAGYRRQTIVAGALSLAVLVISPPVPRTLGQHVATLVGLREEVAYEVARGGRSFRLADREQAESIDAILSDLQRISSPGDVLFVGPRDLRRTNYLDTFIYFLVPELRPGSFFLEMNPGTANRPGSSLAGEVARADFLVLTSRYDMWDEPNASSEYGSTEPNRVVGRDFCLRTEQGQYQLYGRCG
jgi:hypothetical protein